VEELKGDRGPNAPNFNQARQALSRDNLGSRPSQDTSHQFEQTLLQIKIEALQTQNASLESEKDRLLKSLAQHPQTNVGVKRESDIDGPVQEEDFIEDLQNQLRDAQVARDNAFKVLFSSTPRLSINPPLNPN
jgi:hypothetical protein